MKYRKPVAWEEVDAVRVSWQNFTKVCEFVPKTVFVSAVLDALTGKEALQGVSRTMGIKLNLAGAEVIAREGDWVLKDAAGAVRVCSSRQFVDEYTPVLPEICT